MRAPVPRKAIAAVSPLLLVEAQQDEDPSVETNEASVDTPDRVSSARPQRMRVPPHVATGIETPLRTSSAPPRPPTQAPSTPIRAIRRPVTPPIVRSPSRGNATPRDKRVGPAQVRADLNKHALEFGLDDENALRDVRLSVAEHGSEVDEEKLRKLFMAYFSNSAVEIEAAIKGTSFQVDADSYDYSQSFLPMLVSTNEHNKDELLAAAIVVEKRTKNNKSVVHEIVWFATSNSESSKGLGGLLFANLHYMASCMGVFALIVESTNRALTWWMSRPGVHICSTVLRSNERPSLKKSSTRLASLDAENNKLRAIMDGLLNPPISADGNGGCSTPCSAPGCKIKGRGNIRRCSTPSGLGGCGGIQSGSQSVGGGRRGANKGRRRNSKAEGENGNFKKMLSSHFVVRVCPTKAMDALYQDTIFRDNKGNVTSSSPEFEGKPYRYAVGLASHIIFPIGAQFRAALEFGGMLMHKDVAVGDVARVNTPSRPNSSTDSNATGGVYSVKVELEAEGAIGLVSNLAQLLEAASVKSGEENVTRVPPGSNNNTQHINTSSTSSISATKEVDAIGVVVTRVTGKFASGNQSDTSSASAWSDGEGAGGSSAGRNVTIGGDVFCGNGTIVGGSSNGNGDDGDTDTEDDVMAENVSTTGTTN